jgi:hypothetical protein
MQAQTDHTMLEALHRETARRLSRQDSLRAMIRGAMALFGPDEQPRVDLPDPGLWSEEWRDWDRSARRYRYRPSIRRLVSKDDYDLLCRYGRLEQMETAWAALSTRLLELGYLPVPGAAKAQPVSAPAPAVARRLRDLDRHIAKVRQAIVDILVEDRNADVVGSGACALVANKLNVAQKTMNGWFTGTGIKPKQLLRQLATEEAAAEANQKREQRTNRLVD